MMLTFCSITLNKGGINLNNDGDEKRKRIHRVFIDSRNGVRAARTSYSIVEIMIEYCNHGTLFTVVKARL